jgi:magnesium-transporting ATPase (P-type)
MSYRDPRDPRDPGTARYEQGYPPESRAYSRRDDTYAPGGTYYAARPQPPEPPRRRVGPDINVGMFVGGVVMTGVVTGLAAWLAAWVIRAIVDQVNESGKYGVWNPVARDEYWFALVGFLCALAAGALWYVLQIITPSPDQFYVWIVGLLVAAAVIIPVVLSDQISVKIGTAVMHLIIGLPLLSLIPAMGRKSINRR